MTITECLTAEHGVFRTVFDFIELLLAKPLTLAEAKTLGSLVEALLCHHAEAEENLVLVALDHALAERGRFDRLHQDHHEIDDSLKRVRTARTISEARRLLQETVTASRHHFDHEERRIFPLIDRVLRRETLTELNAAWTRRRRVLAGGPTPPALLAAARR